MSIKETVKEQNEESINQIRKQYMGDIRSYYMQNRFRILDLPKNYPNLFIALTYVVAVIVGWIIP